MIPTLFIIVETLVTEQDGWCCYFLQIADNEGLHNYDFIVSYTHSLILNQETHPLIFSSHTHNNVYH